MIVKLVIKFEYKLWFKGDKLHRDGRRPAVIFNDGTMYEYWEDDHYLGCFSSPEKL